LGGWHPQSRTGPRSRRWVRLPRKYRQLQPLTFRLKTDPQGTVQYGLIAEEVVKVYPELVIRDGTGTIEGVRYEELAPMLLKDVQQQQQKIAIQDVKLTAQGERLANQDERLTAQREQLREVVRRLSAMKYVNEVTRLHH
jgi:hypothetical protein